MQSDSDTMSEKARLEDKKSSRSSSGAGVGENAVLPNEEKTILPEANLAAPEDPNADEKDAKNDKEAGDDEDDDKYLAGGQLAILLVAVLASVFIVALSNTIISTAIPTLTTVFNSYSDIAWYTSGEQLTATAFQLPFGKAYALLNLKWTFLVSLIIYLIGSLVCAVAPSSAVLIIGRAIAGVGNAGVFTGVFIIIARSVPLRKRALYAGSIGATFAIAAVLGPIVGELLRDWSKMLSMMLIDLQAAYSRRTLPGDGVFTVSGVDVSIVR